ncbi:MAG: hypothetical protein ACRDYY_05600 [Acidimicrobiales bacterium]
MSFEPTREPTPPRGTWRLGARTAPPAAARLGRLSKLALVSGASVGLALGGAGIAYAAGSGASATSPSSPSSPASPGGHTGHPGRHAMGGLGGLGGRVLHGQATVRTPAGTDKTAEIQVGVVSGVTTTSITVKSSDGYTHTYDVVPTTVVDSQAGGISSVSNGDTVRVIATTDNGEDTATNVADATKLRASRAGFGFAPPVKPAPNNGSTTTS